MVLNGRTARGMGLHGQVSPRKALRLVESERTHQPIKPPEADKRKPSGSAPSGDMSKTAQLLLSQHTTPGPGQIPPSSAAALRRHENSAKILMDLITTGAQSKEATVWRNTCEWLLACKVSFHVLTLRHDSAEQVRKAKEAEKKDYAPATHGAYFGIDRALPLGSASTTQAAYGKISIVPFADRRFSEAGKIVIIDPSAITDPEELKRMLAYEVQFVVAREQPDSDEERYRSEFNARWIAGYHSNKLDGLGTAGPTPLRGNLMLRGMHNARQAAVFADIHDSSEDVHRAWSHPWSGRSFQRFVFNLKAPQGKNLLNSVRIDNLCLALAAKPVVMATVNAAIASLTPPEAEALRSPVGGMVQTWHDVLRDVDLPDKDKASVAKDLGIYGFSS